jgi:two-component system, OmpR family, phosphate regulon sensor histidine kinase PhoR
MRVLGVGMALLVLVLVGVIVYLFLTVKAIALSQRQSNFIDSVTHELKSPLASLKLYLQTLTRRAVPAEQQADFHRFMLQDVERLDTLIDHLLDAAKTLQRKDIRRPRGRPRSSPCCSMSGKDPCTATASHRRASSSPAKPAAGRSLKVLGREADLEIVFRNLIDNAVKYALPDPRVEVTVGRTLPRGGCWIRVADNGPGIPFSQRTN